jgi:hypothetical protein
VLGKPYGTSAFFCLSYRCLEVGIYPEIPATGHLDKRSLDFPRSSDNSDMIPKFQLAVSAISWNNSDLSSTNENPSLWRPQNDLSKLCNTPSIRNKNYTPLSQATTTYYYRQWCCSSPDTKCLSLHIIFSFHILLYCSSLLLSPTHGLKTTWRELKSIYFTNQVKSCVGNLTEQKSCIRLSEFPTDARIQEVCSNQNPVNFLRMT